MVNFSIAKAAQSIFPKAAVACLLTGAALLGVPNPVQAIDPAYYTTTEPTGNYRITNSGATYGFAFDTDRVVRIDALGFSGRIPWNLYNSSYDVTLWSYENSGNDPNDFTVMATRKFTPTGNLTPYYQQDGYFWQNIGIISLPDTTNGDPLDTKGYIIGVTGDFRNTNDGNVQFEGGATGVFRPGLVNKYSVFNTDADPNLFYPIPVYNPTDPNLTLTQYWNGNFSLAPVPAPLPLLGVAAAFSWTRRLRRRISLSQ